MNQMKKLMLEFELDTEKMPLGKLSKNQMQKAYTVLTELQTIIDKENNPNKLIEATNRFYTLIPHSFGVDKVPILKDKETIKVGKSTFTPKVQYYSMHFSKKSICWTVSWRWKLPTT